MVNAVMLNAVMLYVIRPSAIMLSVATTKYSTSFLTLGAIDFLKAFFLKKKISSSYRINENLSFSPTDRYFKFVRS
jgi:hypothetical protein